MFSVMKNVFLVKTPLQMLNAIEAKYSFGLETEDCIMILMADRKSQPQLTALSNSVDEWGEVLILNDVSFLSRTLGSSQDRTLCDKMLNFKLFNKSFFNVRRLNKITKYLGEVKYIFIGHERYIYMRHFANVMNHQEVVLLDDGAATLLIAKDRKEAVDPEFGIGLKKKIKLYGKRYLQGVKGKSLDRYCFFTIYDIFTKSSDRVVKNEFKHLRDNLGSVPVTNEVYFLGAPISEVGIISQDSYFQHMEKIKKYFGDEVVKYIAHRRESPEKLEKIRNNLNFEVILYDYPIEYQLAYAGLRPKIMASFFSSALDSCRIIFGENLKIISFKLDLEGSPNKKQVELVYDSYKRFANKYFILESDY